MTESTPGAERERKEMAKRITDDEVRSALSTAGVTRCQEAYFAGLTDAGVPGEPIQVTVGVLCRAFSRR